MVTKRIIGIQGGHGSYNELALLKYLQTTAELDAEIRYLYSTKKVFDQLKNKQIEWGQFAIGNSVGGYVAESLEAIADFLSAGNGINVVASYTIPITHHIIGHSSSSLQSIKKIISHPQTFKQCKQNLQANYPQLELVEGVGEYSDPAKVAQSLAEGELSFDVATLSNPRLAENYDLKLLSHALQDSDSNMTQFLLVKNVDRKSVV